MSVERLKSGRWKLYYRDDNKIQRSKHFGRNEEEKARKLDETIKRRKEVGLPVNVEEINRLAQGEDRVPGSSKEYSDMLEELAELSAKVYESGYWQDKDMELRLRLISKHLETVIEILCTVLSMSEKTLIDRYAKHYPRYCSQEINDPQS